MPKWALPLTILILLFLAFAFRWETGPQKTTNYTTKVFMHDRWTGQTWVKTYDFSQGRTKEELSTIPYNAPIRPLNPDSNNSNSTILNFTGSNNLPKLSPEEYKIALAEYDTAYAEYKKNVSNYNDTQYLIRDGLNIAWGLLVLISVFWFFRAVKRERELAAQNCVASKPHDR